MSVSDISFGAAESMDRMYRHQRFIYDFTRKPYLLGRDAMIAQLSPPSGGTVLEIGCGTGRNLIRVAHAYPTARLYGFDVSEAMLATARKSIATAGLAARIEVATADARHFEPTLLFGRPRFDRVFVSYVLSMIPDWRDVLCQAVGCLAPGGALHIVDFGQQQKLPQWFRPLLFSWLDLFHVTPRADLERELRFLAQSKGLHLDWRELHRGYADYAVLTA
jgi:S-adenosylmethionine-diacylgycerolhomoserine-N-methlytransferase